MTRDELRKIYTFLKKETGVKGVTSRNLGSKEECVEAIRDLVCGTLWELYREYKWQAYNTFGRTSYNIN